MCDLFFVDILEPTNTEIDAISFLKTHRTPWSVVEEKWKETFPIRKQYFDDEEEIKVILATFPILGDITLGWVLVTNKSKIL